MSWVCAHCGTVTGGASRNRQLCGHCQSPRDANPSVGVLCSDFMFTELAGLEMFEPPFSFDAVNCVATILRSHDSTGAVSRWLRTQTVGAATQLAAVFRWSVEQHLADWPDVMLGAMNESVSTIVSQSWYCPTEVTVVPSRSATPTIVGLSSGNADRLVTRLDMCRDASGVEPPAFCEIRFSPPRGDVPLVEKEIGVVASVVHWAVSSQQIETVGIETDF